MQIALLVICLMIFGARMNILVIIQGKISRVRLSGRIDPPPSSPLPLIVLIVKSRMVSMI